MPQEALCVVYVGAHGGDGGCMYMRTRGRVRVRFGRGKSYGIQHVQRRQLLQSRRERGEARSRTDGRLDKKKRRREEDYGITDGQETTGDRSLVVIDGYK